MCVNVVYLYSIIHSKLLYPWVLRLQYVALYMPWNSFHQSQVLDLSGHASGGNWVSTSVQVALTVAIHFSYRKETALAASGAYRGYLSPSVRRGRLWLPWFLKDWVLFLKLFHALHIFCNLRRLNNRRLDALYVIWSVRILKRFRPLRFCLIHYIAVSKITNDS